MKGKQLSLEEVLQLEDGSKVWVEDSEPDYSCLCFLNLKENELTLCEDSDEMYMIDQDLYIAEENKDVEFYEWTESYYNPMMLFDEDDKVIYLMAQEICNLRSLDLTDENIEMIVEEFS